MGKKTIIEEDPFEQLMTRVQAYLHQELEHSAFVFVASDFDPSEEGSLVKSKGPAMVVTNLPRSEASLLAFAGSRAVATAKEPDTRMSE